MQKLAHVLVLLIGLITAAAAQAPPPVPALPDAARLTSYNLTASTCTCSVGFALYGDGTDVDNWIDVFVNGVSYPSTDPMHGWTITSATGALGAIPRPITNAVLTFNTAQTGAVQIVGARRPRRLSQFPESRGVTARDLNQVVTDLTAQNREQWDELLGTLRGQPGEVFAPLPPAAQRGSLYQCYDGAGAPALCPSTAGAAPNVPSIVPDQFCTTVDRTGATDMGPCINTTIAQASHCGSAGNALLRLRAGTYLITTPLVPRSCVTIVGDGRGRTVLLTNTATPLVQPAATQLVHFGLYGVSFQDSGANPGATVMTFGAGFQGSTLANIGFHGYTTGTLFNHLSTGTVTNFSDTHGVFNSPNSFMNLYQDWLLDDQAANGIYISGASTTPCDTNTATNVNTLHTFKDITLWGITRVGVNIARFADTNRFIGNNIIKLVGAGAAVGNPQASFRNIAIQLGDDNAICQGNNDVAIETIDFTPVMGSPATSIILVNFGNGTFDNTFYFQSDVNPANYGGNRTIALAGGAQQPTGFNWQPGVTGNNYTISGRNFIQALNDGVGNILQTELDSTGKYRFIAPGTSSRPSFGFSSDIANGFYQTGNLMEWGFTGAIRSGGPNKDGALTLAGSTSGTNSCGIAPTGGVISCNAPWKFAQVQLNSMLSSSSSPTTAGLTGFCTAPAITAANGTAAFGIAVGTACAAGTGTVTMPVAATNGWNCGFNSAANPGTHVIAQTNSTTTSVQLTDFSRTTGAPQNFASGDTIRSLCAAY